MDKLAAMQAFVAVSRFGSFSEAARSLETSPSGVTKAVSRLEAALNIRLFNRTTHGVALTDEGAFYLAECEAALESIADAEERLRARSRSPQGVLRLSSPSAIGRVHIIPRMGVFLEKYPEVRLELVLSDLPLDLVENRLDIALRIGSPPDGRVTARKLASTRRVTVAAPDYLRRFGTPNRVEDLIHHRCLMHVYSGWPVPWRFAGTGAQARFMPQSRLEVNSGDALCAAAVAGLGIAHSNSLLFEHELAKGTLVEALRGLSAAGDPLYAVCLPKRSSTPRIKLLIDSLSQLFRPFDRAK